MLKDADPRSFHAIYLVCGFTGDKTPDNVKDIESDAFAECTNLKEFSFPRKIKIIHSVFRNCDSLETIFLPREVTKIDCEFKYSCKNLKRIIIPKGSRQKFEKLIERKYHYLIVEK